MLKRTKQYLTFNVKQKSGSIKNGTKQYLFIVGGAWLLSNKMKLLLVLNNFVLIN